MKVKFHNLGLVLLLSCVIIDAKSNESEKTENKNILSKNNSTNLSNQKIFTEGELSKHLSRIFAL